MKAFSLIELMVVIAIVSVLSAAALPAYKKYVIKTKIINSLTILDDFSDKLLSEYAKTGSFPSTISYNGVTLTDGGGWVSMNIDNTYSMFYDEVSADSGVFLGANISNLEGMSGYTAPVGLDDSNSSIVFYAIRVDSNGIVSRACGHHSVGGFTSYSPPLEYLPSSCQCTTVLSFADSGTPCS